MTRFKGDIFNFDNIEGYPRWEPCLGCDKLAKCPTDYYCNRISKEEEDDDLLLL